MDYKFSVAYQQMLSDLDNQKNIQDLYMYVKVITTYSDNELYKQDTDFLKLSKYEVDALSLHPQVYSFKKEGERRLNPCIDNFSKDQLDYYLKRFKSSTNLQLTCLYGDILLDYKGPIKIG